MKRMMRCGVHCANRAGNYHWNCIFAISRTYSCIFLISKAALKADTGKTAGTAKDTGCVAPARVIFSGDGTYT